LYPPQVFHYLDIPLTSVPNQLADWGSLENSSSWELPKTFHRNSIVEALLLVSIPLHVAFGCPGTNHLLLRNKK
jgi:hypothetical protein